MAATIKSNSKLNSSNSSNIYKDKVSPGDFYQYKDLCAVLGIERKSGGNNIKNQITDLNRYMLIEKDEVNKGYVVLDVYDSPIPKVDKRKNRDAATHSIYVKYIELELLKILSEEQGYSINRTSKDLYRELGFANVKYFLYESKDKRGELINLYKDHNIEAIDIDVAFQKCGKKFNKILDDSLKSLESRFIIKHDRVYNIGVKNDDGFIIQKTVYSNDKKTIKQILVAQQNALERLGLKSEKQLYILDKYEEFYKYVNQEVKRLYGWEYIYRSHSIVYDEKGVINAISDVEFELNKITLNCKVIDSLKKKTDKDIKDQKKDIILLEGVLSDEVQYSERKDIPDEVLPEDDNNQSRYRMIQNLLLEELLRI